MMRRTFWLALPLLTAVSATYSTASSAEREEPNSLTYAIAGDAFVPQSAVHFGFLDIGTGTFQLIADLPNGAAGLARERGTILGVDSSNNLIRINPDGKAMVVGPTGITTPALHDDARVDVFASLKTGELFLMDYSNNLYSVDRRTGAATLIGPTGIPVIVFRQYSSSLAGDCHSLFFTLAERDDAGNLILPPSLYRIDPRNAAYTLVGPTARAVVGSGFINGTLYGFSRDLRPFGINEPPHVFSIDTTTGAATRVTDLNVPGVGGAVSLPGGEGCETESPDAAR
jgi:hypothetical protein